MMKEGHLRSALRRPRPRLPGRVAYLHLHRPRRRSHRAHRARRRRSRCSKAVAVYDLVDRRLRPRRSSSPNGRPKRIGVNMSEEIGAADGLSHASLPRADEDARRAVRLALRLGREAGLRLQIAPRGVARSAAFAEAGELSRQIAERALSNEVITPGRDDSRGRRLVDAGSAARTRARLLVRHADRSTSPDRAASRTVSNGAIIQRGDVLVIDWGVCLTELLHRREAHGVRAQAGRGRAAARHPERLRPGAQGARDHPPHDHARPTRRRNAEAS